VPSLPDDLHQHALAAAAVKLAVEDLLSRSEIQLARRDGRHNLTSHDRQLGTSNQSSLRKCFMFHLLFTWLATAIGMPLIGKQVNGWPHGPKWQPSGSRLIQ
jgi:hypothetical protein